MHSHAVRAFDLSRRAVILCALVVLGLVGGVVLNKLYPHSNIGALLFGVSLFLGVPTALPEIQAGAPTQDEPNEAKGQKVAVQRAAGLTNQEHREQAPAAVGASEGQECWPEACSGRASEA